MPKLERSLSLWQITLMSIGIILGAGIYVVIGEAAGLTGNSVWLSFIIGAIVASFSGLSYAELASRFPKAGAEYVYIENSFGNRVAWMAGYWQWFFRPELCCWLVGLFYQVALSVVQL